MDSLFPYYNVPFFLLFSLASTAMKSTISSPRMQVYQPVLFAVEQE